MHEQMNQSNTRRPNYQCCTFEMRTKNTIQHTRFGLILLLYVFSFSNLIWTAVNRLSHPIFPCIGNKQRFPKLSRPLNPVAHALHRLSLPPPGQPPTSSPCVCPSRRQSGGAALNFSKNKTFHLAEFPEFQQSFNKIKWSEKELQT